MKRLSAFLSYKQQDVIAHAIRDEYPAIWGKHERSVRKFFAHHPLGDALQMITAIDPDKFPSGYNAVKHTPDALKQTLYLRRSAENPIHLKSNGSRINWLAARILSNSSVPS